MRLDVENSPSIDPSSTGGPSPGSPPRGPSSLLGKTAWSSLASIWTAAASAITVVVVARVLGVSGAGEVAYGLWVATTAGQVALFALPQAAMRFLASPTDRSGVARWIAHRGTLLVVPGSAIAVAATLASGRPPLVVVTTGVLTATVMLGTLGQGILSGEQQFRRLSTLSALAALLQVAGAAVGCALGGAAGGLLGHAAGQIPLMLGIRASDDSGGVAPEVVRRLKAFALETWIAITASLVAWSRLEFVFLQAQGPEAVALYSVALTIAQLATQPALLLGSALLPHFGELVGGAHTLAARETFRAVTRVFASFALPLCFGLAAVSPALVPLVFGKGFASAAVPATIVVATSVVIPIGTATSALLYAHERTRYNAVIAIASGLLAATGFTLMIPRFGAIGAAIVRAGVQALGVLAGFAYAMGPLRARPPSASLARAAVAAASAAAAGRVVVLLGGATWPSLIAAIAVVALVYLLAARAVRPLEPSDVARIEPVLSRGPAPLRRATSAIVRSLAG